MTLSSRVESGLMEDRPSSVAKLIARCDPQVLRTHIGYRASATRTVIQILRAGNEHRSDCTAPNSILNCLASGWGGAQCAQWKI
jgi:hypothetical protein